MMTLDVLLSLAQLIYINIEQTFIYIK